MLHIQHDTGQKQNTSKKMEVKLLEKHLPQHTADNIIIIRDFLAFLFATHLKRTAQDVLLVPD